MDDKNQEIIKAAKELVEKLDAMHENAQFKSVWTLYYAHVGNYSGGPNYGEEFEKLKELLKD